MQIKIVTLDVRLSENTKRAIRWVILPVAVLAGSMAVARAYDTSWIAPSQQVSASKLKADLDEVQSRLATIYYAEATSAITAPTDSTWVNVPGLTASFTTTGSANAELYTLAWIATTSAASACGLRFVLDGSVVGGPSGYEGDAIVNQPFTAPSFVPITGFRRLAVNAGPHTASVQIQKEAGIFAGTTCGVGSTTYPAIGRLRVAIGP